MLNFILGAVLSALFAACFITPVLYSLFTFPWPFSRVFDRVLLAGLVVYLIIRRKRLKQLFSAGKKVPLKVSLVDARVVLLGALLTFIPALIAIPTATNGMLELKTFDAEYWLSLVPKLLLTALTVSILEELVFRALLFKGLAIRFGTFIGMIVSSLVYAVVHFLTPVKTYQYPGWSPFVGVEYLGLVFQRLAEPGITRGFLGLFLVGFVLAFAYLKRGLPLCIGLHAGWILAVKVAFYATNEIPGVSFVTGLGRRYFLVGEPLVWGITGLTLAVIFLVKLPSDKSV